MSSFTNAWAMNCPPYWAGSFIVNNRFLNNQVNAYTVRSLIQGDIRAASIISSSKQYLSPIGSSIVGEASNGVVDTISKINYFSK